MKLTRKEKNKYINKKPIGYYGFCWLIDFYVMDIIYDCDDYLIIKEASNNKLHCLKIYDDDNGLYIKYYNKKIYTGEIARY